ncbi:MAG: N-6 DNA methylase [Synergistaceae bacterium]|jgi:type I restriction-modification system DNA methylase subunit|nr:N-6 DNA methylase [Synergistaceae bacterium]
MTSEHAVGAYLRFLADNPRGGEITYRTPLENLLNAIQVFPAKTTKVVQEDRTGEVEVNGTPDFFIYEGDGTLFKSLVGFVECKLPGFPLDDLVSSEQIKKYSKTTDNIIVTDYRRFMLLQKGTKTRHDVTLSDTPTAIQDFLNLLEAFYGYEYPYLRTKKDVAFALAKQSFYYAVFLREFLEDKANAKHSFYVKFHALLREYQKSIHYHYELADFCDVYSQSLVYGLMLARLESGAVFDEYTMDWLPGLADKYPLLHEFLAQGYESYMPARIRTALISVGKNVNHVNVEAVEAEFMRGAEEDAQKSDIAVYLYEDFLSAYDKWRGTERRKENGVYYTPFEAADFITRGVEHLIQKHFNPAGFAARDVKVLDFACGTGTFLRSVYGALVPNSADEQRRLVAKRKILSGIFGFEVLFTPYIVAHTVLTRFLEHRGVHLSEGERLGIYQTNTLDTERQRELSPLLPELKHEDERAAEIKNSEAILAIIGNPPYFIGKSQAEKGEIDALLKDYKSGLREKKINLDDMYVKFIRFAEWKIAEWDKGHFDYGVIGIIVNNSWLDGVTHRRMREHLLETFDEAYILNLHGNARRNEAGVNIFDVMVGISVVFLVRFKERAKRKRVRYFSARDLLSRASKLNFLKSTDITKIEWKELHPKAPDFWLVDKDLSLAKEFNNFWKLRAAAKGAGRTIFTVSNSGIKNDRDELLVAYDKVTLERNMRVAFSDKHSNEFVKQYKITNSSSYAFADKLKEQDFCEGNIRRVHYRVWDERYLYYAAGFTSRPAENVSQHFDTADRRGNIGLCFTRNIDGDVYKDVFVSDRPIDIHIMSGQNYLAPLWIYKDGKREANFTDDFTAFLASLPFAPSPEDVFAYIYSVLHSPAYRAKYAELLKSSFPAVPVTRDEGVFAKYAELGRRLIDLHLLRRVPPDKLNISMGGVNRDFVLKKIERKENALLLTTGEGRIITITGISDGAWDFEIGSHRPVERWLKYRIHDGAVLSPGEDLTHLRRMVAAVQGTIEVMNDLGGLGELYLKSLSNKAEG